MSLAIDTLTHRERLHVLGIAGSLRTGSVNRALIAAARELAPPGVELEPYDLHGIPLFDEDVEARGDPPEVVSLKAAISHADALLLATPEYNGGTSAVLKNAIDWASRPYTDSVLAGKPVAIIGATPGRGGTAGAQEQLRVVIKRAGAEPIAQPEVLVAGAHDVLSSGALTDPALREQVMSLLAAVRHHAQAARTATKRDRARAA